MSNVIPLHTIVTHMHNALPWELGKTVFAEVVREVCKDILDDTTKKKMNNVLEGIKHCQAEAYYRTDVDQIYQYLKESLDTETLAIYEEKILKRLQERSNEFSIKKK